MMNERPILFSAPMVRALLEGRKTQTRRVVKPQPPATMTTEVFFPAQNEWCFTGPQRDAHGAELPPEAWQGGWPECGSNFSCPYGKPGDRLWVRETWAIEDCGRRVSVKSVVQPNGWLLDRLQYVATDKAPHQLPGQAGYWWNSRPSIHMPRWASRLTLEITDVRVQRLQDISEEDARAEGADPVAEQVSSSAAIRYRAAFHSLWTSINGPGSWDANPWVWALTFSVIQEQK